MEKKKKKIKSEMIIVIEISRFGITFMLSISRHFHNDSILISSHNRLTNRPPSTCAPSSAAVTYSRPSFRTHCVYMYKTQNHRTGRVVSFRSGATNFTRGKSKASIYLYSLNTNSKSTGFKETQYPSL